MVHFGDLFLTSLTQDWYSTCSLAWFSGDQMIWSPARGSPWQPQDHGTFTKNDLAFMVGFSMEKTALGSASKDVPSFSRAHQFHQQGSDAPCWCAEGGTLGAVNICKYYLPPTPAPGQEQNVRSCSAVLIFKQLQTANITFPQATPTGKGSVVTKSSPKIYK